MIKDRKLNCFTISQDPQVILETLQRVKEDENARFDVAVYVHVNNKTHQCFARKNFQ